MTLGELSEGRDLEWEECPAEHLGGVWNRGVKPERRFLTSITVALIVDFYVADTGLDA